MVFFCNNVTRIYDMSIIVLHSRDERPECQIAWFGSPPNPRMKAREGAAYFQMQLRVLHCAFRP